ncbi:MAG: hypothetical protein ACMG6S_31485 [Byssovorax sp.]
MVQLIAHAPEDGWAYAREGDSILLLRPPYQGNRLVVGLEDVERAVTVHGYLARDLRFKTERDLIQHLRDEVVRSWPVQGAPEELREDLLVLAETEEIDLYLDEATAWLDDGRTLEVEALSNRLFGAKALTYPQRQRIASLLEAIRAQRSASRQAPVASKFARVGASTKAGAPPQDFGSAESNVLRPTG